MNIYLKLLLFYFSIDNARSFFFTKPNKDIQKTDDYSVLGVPNDLLENYKTDKFLCDKGSKVLSSKDINDDFCDCFDGSDEPGTSACSSGNFYCTNKGFRSMKIPSSNVNDGICDCCDGSDEKNCPNICDAELIAERKKMDRLLAAFRSGSQIRESYISKVKNEKEIIAESLNDILNDIRNEDILISELKSKETAEKLRIKEEEDNNRKYIVNLASKILGLDKMDANELSSVFSTILSILNPSHEELEKQLKKFKSSIYFFAHDDTNEENIIIPVPEYADEYEEGNPAHADPDPEEGEGEGVLSHEDPHTETESELDEHDGSVISDEETDSYTGTLSEQDIEATVDESVLSPEFSSSSSNRESEASVGNESNQNLNDFDACVGFNTTDSRLIPICKAFPSDQLIQSSIEFFVSLIGKKKLYRQIELLLDFNNIHHTSEGASEHILTKMAAEMSLVGEVGSDGQSDMTNAEVFPQTQEMINLRTAFQTASIPPAISVQSDLLAASGRHSALVSRRTDVEKVRADLTKFKDHLAFLAVEKECFELLSGKFIYNVCMLDKTTQKEDHGENREVTLGHFDSLQDGTDGQVLMQFTGGANCHVFGDRKATVTVRCGAENKLLDASEPTTCGYSLTLESPAACTPEYGRAMGLDLLL